MEEIQLQEYDQEDESEDGKRTAYEVKPGKLFSQRWKNLVCCTTTSCQFQTHNILRYNESKDVAAFATYGHNLRGDNPHQKASTNRRMIFLLQLGEHLAKSEIEVGATNSRITRIFSTRNAIEAINAGPLRIVDVSLGGDAERGSTGRIKTKVNCYIYASNDA
ncbi:uncharacterized protein LOC118749586 [Rhagoletis pomonella]|uniref:uncharacterized protein LOC118749586 n=1 Tax=Rhagoletis pomonella TaxID=28610 RepID=UPI0017836C35|nr:uncharacterized protein LOC118749586 [Rhagoletis pomonella]